MPNPHRTVRMRDLRPAVLALLLLASCRGEPGVTATFAATQYNQKPLPFVREVYGYRIEVLASTFEMRADGTWRESGRIRVRNPGDSAAHITEPSSRGTYERRGDRFIFDAKESRTPTPDGRVRVERRRRALPPPMYGLLTDSVLLLRQPGFLHAPPVRITYVQR